jgi:hypothetical protein
MFGVMCVLWGLWTSPSVDDFLALLGARTFRAADAAAVVGTLGAVALIAVLWRRWSLDLPSALAPRRARRHYAFTALPLLLVFGISLPGLRDFLPVRVQAVVRDVRLLELNRADAEQLQRGYYEEIVGVNRRNGQLWEVYMRSEPVDELKTLRDHGGMIGHRNELEHELRPLFGTIFKGATLSTNRFGMRDREYDLARLPASRRLAVLGPSYVMGSGVADGEPFETLVEERLNREWRTHTGLHYELLNFGVPGYSLAQQAHILENGRVGQFQPDAVVLVSHLVDLSRLTDHIYTQVEYLEITDPTVVDILERADVRKGFSRQEVNRRLHPFAPELVGWALRRSAAAIANMQAVAIFALIPQPSDRWDPAGKAVLAGEAARAGFEVIDMEDVYAGHDQGPLGLNQADRHPNSRGHRVIAERFYRELTARPALVGSAKRP